MGAKSEKEIALSIVAEILAVTRNASGRPLSEVKGFSKVIDELE